MKIEKTGDKMQFFKTYIITMLIGILLILILTFTTKDEGSALTNAQEINYNDDWRVIVGQTEEFYNQLPKAVFRNTSDTIILRKQLPKEINNGEAVAFFMGHNIINAYIDDELIYTFDIPEAYQESSKTPGTTWNFINMEKEYAGKTLTLELHPVYKADKANIPQMVYGDRAKIVLGIVQNQAGALLISGLLLFIGLGILVALIFFRNQLRIPNYMVWLGLFSISAGVWFIIETQVLSLLYAQNVQGSRIAFVVLQLLFIPNISFAKNFCQEENDKIYNTLCVFNIGLLTVTTVMQFIGFRDYRQTSIYIYILFALSGVWMISLFLKKIIKGSKDERASYIIYLCGTIVVIIAVLIDIINYYSTETVDAAKYCRVLILVYVIMLICLVFKDSVHLIRLGEQFEIVSEEAMHDALTKLSNRTAFQKNMSMFRPYMSTAAVMFDLNNLKYFNDAHGHAMGDYYIIVCSEIIQDTFGAYGSVYRMGGDEFCAIIEGVSKERFLELQKAMNDRIEALNGRFFEDKMSVASGYAEFDAQKDTDILATVKRADQKMYECKIIMKQNKVDLKTKEK